MNLYSAPEGFDEASGLLIALDKKEQRNINRDNTIIISCKDKAEAIAKDFQKPNKYLSPANLKDLYEADSIPVEENEEVTFNSYFKKITDAKSGKTKTTYQNTLNKIEEYFPGKLDFDKIDKTWLKAFIQKMLSEKIKLKILFKPDYRSVLRVSISGTSDLCIMKQ